jgi:protein O-GlcNAc transferase
MNQPHPYAPLTSSLDVKTSFGFADWLFAQHIGFSFTTYQTNRLFCVGSTSEGRLPIHERLFDKPMGLFAQGDRLYMSTRYQIWQFDNLLAEGEKRQGCDRLYIPKRAHTTGDLNVHDVVLDEAGELLFVNTDFSCLARLSTDYSFEPIWQPPFIGKLVAEDRCHLNGLAMREGQPAYMTACSTTDSAAGWRDHRVKSGVVIDIQHNEIIAANLSMPHSPRWYQDKLWLLNSGTGELGHIDFQTGQFIPLTFCPGFVRGLAFWQNFAFVGLSKLRSRPFTGLALEERLSAMGQTPQCGLMVIDLNTGQTLHWLHLEGVVEELFDVVVLPGVCQPQAMGFQSEDIERLVTFPGSGGIVSTKPTVKRPSVGGMAPIAGVPRQVWDGADATLEDLTNVDLCAQTLLKYQRVFHLNAESLTPYDVFTYPSLQQRWKTQPQQGELLGISASADGEMVAFAIAERFPEHTAHLLSLFVAEAYRQQGVATRLMAHLERTLQSEGCTQVWVEYEPTILTLSALELILSKLGWHPLQTPQAAKKRRSHKILDATEALQSPFNQAKGLAQQGDLEGAIAAYQRLLTLHPTVAQVHCNLGAIWQMQGHREKAIAAYQQAIQLKPDLSVAQTNLTNLLNSTAQGGKR